MTRNEQTLAFAEELNQKFPIDSFVWWKEYPDDAQWLKVKVYSIFHGKNPNSAVFNFVSFGNLYPSRNRVFTREDYEFNVANPILP